MNSDQIFAVIETIAATPEKNTKVSLVAANTLDPDFVRVLKYALDPLVTYGIRKRPQVEDNGVDVFDQSTWDMLDHLKSRRLSGYAAIEALRKELSRLTSASADLLWRVVTKDLRAGFEASTVNKAMKGLIQTYPYMRCSLPKDMKIEEKDFGWSLGAISQEKADGMFMNLDIEEGGIVRLSSRQGTQFPLDAFDEFCDDVTRIITAGTQTHGEMVVLRNGVVLAREIGNGILNHVQDGGAFGRGETPMFLAWDQIPLTAVVPKGKYGVGYKLRLMTLMRQLAVQPSTHIRLIPTKVVRSMDEAWAHYRELLAQGKEGTVFKKPSAIWKDGTSKEQGKLKLKAPCELRVKGFNEGTGKFVGQLGSLICASECGNLIVSVSGRGDAMRASVWQDRENWLDAIVTVESNAIMPPSDSSELHSLFLPIFVERRIDKTEADSLDRIKAQFQAAIAAA